MSGKMIFAYGDGCPRCPHDAHGAALCDEVDGPRQDRCIFHGVKTLPADPPAVQAWPCGGSGAAIAVSPIASRKSLAECPEPRCRRLFMVPPSRLRIPRHKRPVCGQGDEHGCLCLEPQNHPTPHLFQ